MGSAAEPSRWRQHALTLIGVAVFVVFLAGLGIYTFVITVSTKLHPNPTDVPSVTLTTPSPRWAVAVERARQVARAGLADQNLPGLSAAVGVGGDIVWAEGFGWADMEKRVPVAPGMRFRIGHTSKALTSAAVGLLLEKGRLHLEDEIQVYVPEFPNKQWPVTLRQLMGHVAGIRHYAGDAESAPTAHCQRAADGLKTFANDPLRFEPDTQYGYSTYGWVLVSAAVEASAKEPLSSFMTAQVFKPLGMTATVFESSNEPMADRVTFYQRRFTGDGGEGVVPAAAADYSCFSGAADILSTPSDLVRFGIAINGGRLLRADTVRKLQTPQVLTTGNETEYGLGWMVEEVTLAGAPTRMVHHASRSLKGGTTSFMTFPSRGIVVAVTANVANGITRDIALDIAQAFAEQGHDSLSLLDHFFELAGRAALSACPRCAQAICCSGVIGVGVSPAGTELHRIVSSNPGAEKTKVRTIGSVPMFFPLIQVFAGMNAIPPAWRSRSSSPSQTWAVPLWISRISS